LRVVAVERVGRRSTEERDSLFKDRHEKGEALDVGFGHIRRALEDDVNGRKAVRRQLLRTALVNGRVTSQIRDNKQVNVASLVVRSLGVRTKQNNPLRSKGSPEPLDGASDLRRKGWCHSSIRLESDEEQKIANVARLERTEIGGRLLANLERP
jgi:hypothetical protein